MMTKKAHKIRVEVDRSGRGASIHELESCPIKKNGICRLELIKCNYGQTEIHVPSPVCPMSSKTVVTLKISVK